MPTDGPYRKAQYAHLSTTGVEEVMCSPIHGNPQSIIAKEKGSDKAGRQVEHKDWRLFLIGAWTEWSKSMCQGNGYKTGIVTNTHQGFTRQTSSCIGVRRCATALMGVRQCAMVQAQVAIDSNAHCLYKPTVEIPELLDYSQFPCVNGACRRIAF